MGISTHAVHLARLESLANSGPQLEDRAHVAAVCYRFNPIGRSAGRGPANLEEIEFLLVRTRAGRWTFPKGGVDGDLTFSAAAAREAFEEAGVRGIIEPAPFMLYRHAKSSALESRREFLVSAFLCRVLRVRPALESFRDPTWFAPRDAGKRLAENRAGEFALELDLVLQRALRRIALVASSR